MFEDKVEEFLVLYKAYKKHYKPEATREFVMMEYMTMFIEAKTARDKKRVAKALLRIRVSMKDHYLWTYIDEGKLKEIAG